MTCFVVCRCHSQEHRACFTLDTLRLCKKSANSIFFALICVISALSTLLSFSWTFNLFLSMNFLCDEMTMIRKLFVYDLHLLFHILCWHCFIFFMLWVIILFNVIRARFAHDVCIISVISIYIVNSRVVVGLGKTHIGQPNPPHWWGWIPYFVQWVGLGW
jgi:hypothetical protein